jgi:hypothetical protein
MAGVTDTNTMMLEPGDTFVVCHPFSSPSILEFCDMKFEYLSNGDNHGR